MRSFSFDADVVTAAMPLADTDTSITHQLNRVPSAAFVIHPDGRAWRVYKGSAAWTSTAISVRANIAGLSATLLLV